MIECILTRLMKEPNQFSLSDLYFFLNFTLENYHIHENFEPIVHFLVFMDSNLNHKGVSFISHFLCILHVKPSYLKDNSIYYLEKGNELLSNFTELTLKQRTLFYLNIDIIINNWIPLTKNISMNNDFPLYCMMFYEISGETFFEMFNSEVILFFRDNFSKAFELISILAQNFHSRQALDTDISKIERKLQKMIKLYQSHEC